MKMMKPDGGLNQALVVKAEGTPGRTPEIFPGLVGFEVAAGVEKKYSVLKEVGHDRYL
jgi:hypothetical protein